MEREPKIKQLKERIEPLHGYKNVWIYESFSGNVVLNEEQENPVLLHFREFPYNNTQYLTPIDRSILPRLRDWVTFAYPDQIWRLSVVIRELGGTVDPTVDDRLCGRYTPRKVPEIVGVRNGCFQFMEPTVDNDRNRIFAPLLLAMGKTQFFEYVPGSGVETQPMPKNPELKEWQAHAPYTQAQELMLSAFYHGALGLPDFYKDINVEDTVILESGYLRHGPDAMGGTHSNHLKTVRPCQLIAARASAWFNKDNKPQVVDDEQEAE